MRLIESTTDQEGSESDPLAFIEDVMCDAWSRIAQELETHLHTDPDEVGWSEWWRGFIRLEAAMEVTTDLKLTIDERLRPS